MGLGEAEAAFFLSFWGMFFWCVIGEGIEVCRNFNCCDRAVGFANFDEAGIAGFKMTCRGYARCDQA